MVFAAGHVVYFGEGRSALTHFANLGYAVWYSFDNANFCTPRFDCPANFNPADFIIDTISKPTFNATSVTSPQFTNIQFFNSRINACDFLYRSRAKSWTTSTTSQLLLLRSSLRASTNMPLLSSLNLEYLRIAPWLMHLGKYIAQWYFSNFEQGIRFYSAYNIRCFPLWDYCWASCIGI